MFFKNPITSTINSISKCSTCRLNFNIDYERHLLPMCLPCGYSICQICLMKIEKKALNKQFKCLLCGDQHVIPEDGFSLNILVNKFVMLKSRGTHIYRGRDTEMLRVSLRNIEIEAKELNYKGREGDQRRMQHYEYQKQQVQLATKNTILQVTKVNDELIQRVNDYEKKCVKAFYNRETASASVSSSSSLSSLTTD